jgi:hypothetical protein
MASTFPGMNAKMVIAEFAPANPGFFSDLFVSVHWQLRPQGRLAGRGYAIGPG